MKCVYCGFLESKVIDSRTSDDSVSIRRRRECLQCGKRFTTYEKLEVIPMIVVKKDGSRESFDRDKLLAGMLKACEKRPLSIEQIEHLIDEVEFKLQNSMQKEIPSNQIGEMAMASLKDLDEIAYVRFASVYKHFKDVNTFMDELKTLLSDKSL